MALVQLLWNLNMHGNFFITVAWTPQFRCSFAFQPKSCSRLRSGWDVQFHIAVNGLDLDFWTKRCLNKTDWLIEVDLSAITFKYFAWSNTKDDKQVTIRTAVIAGFTLTLQAHLIAIFHSGGNSYFNRMLFAYPTSSMTCWAFFLDFFSGSVTNITFLLGHHAAKRRLPFNLNNSPSMTFWTCNRWCSGLSTRTITVLADSFAIIFNFGLLTKDSFFKGQVHFILQIPTLTRSILATRTAPAKEWTENIFKAASAAEVTETAKVAVTTSTAATEALVASCSELVVLSFLLRITQNFISFVDFFEFFFRPWFVVQIRMIFLWKFSISLFDFSIRRILADT